MNLEIWWAFIVLWIATTVPVGPNVINCISISQRQGFLHSLWTLPGIALSALLHISIGLSGLAAIILANPFLFDLIRYAGAGYMLYMAFNMWRVGKSHLEATQINDTSKLQATYQSFLISVTNPKAIFINIAIFSQFIDPTQPLKAQLLLLVPTALIIDALIYTGYCALGAQLTKLMNKGRRQSLFNRGTGAIYTLIAIGLILYQAPQR